MSIRPRCNAANVCGSAAASRVDCSIRIRAVMGDQSSTAATSAAANPTLRSRTNSATTAASASPSTPRPAPPLSTNARTKPDTSPHRCGRPSSANSCDCTAFTCANNRSEAITAFTSSDGDNAAGSTPVRNAKEFTPGAVETVISHHPQNERMFEGYATIGPMATLLIDSPEEETTP
jgi:hypothetical protein